MINTIMRDAIPVMLPIVLNLTDEEWIYLADRYPGFANVVSGNTYTIVLRAYLAEGRYWLRSDEIYAAMGYKGRSGNSSVILPTGRGERYDSNKHQSDYPDAPKVPRFVPVQSIPDLRDYEIDILTTPYYVCEPGSKQKLTVYPLKIMSVLTAIYDHALRENDRRSNPSTSSEGRRCLIRLTADQQVRGIILTHLTGSLTEEALENRLKQHRKPMSRHQRQVEAYVRKELPLRYEGPVYRDSDYELACHLVGVEWDPTAPNKHQTYFGPLGRLVKDLYKVLDDETMEILRNNQSRRLPLHSYLTRHAISMIRQVLNQFQHLVAFNVYSQGSYTQCLKDWYGSQPPMALDDYNSPKLAADLDHLIYQGQTDLLEKY